MDLNENSKQILRYGHVLLGATTGTVLSMATENPIALVAGSAIGGILPEVLNDFSERVLSRREKIKVGAVTQFAVDKIHFNLNSGKTLNLHFVNQIQEGYRNSAEELYEGILIKARNEAQEKKIKHIGSIFGNSVFIEDITPDDVNHLLSVVEGLTYRKLCIIAFYARNQEIFQSRHIMVDPYVWYPEINFPLSTRAILQDVFELGNQGIIDFANHMVVNHLHLSPGKFRLSDLGTKYYELMSLNEIPAQDLEPVITGLEYKEEYGVNNQGNKNGIPA